MGNKRGQWTWLRNVRKGRQKGKEGSDKKQVRKRDRDKARVGYDDAP